jgi:16S rRNA (cytosine1402-N4)-methyltransferase
MQGQRGTAGGQDPDDHMPSHPDVDPMSYHRPVLPAEVLHYLQPAPGKIFLDATLGGGGHSELLLDAGAQVIALDQDAEALEHARERLRGHAARFCALHANFRDFPALLEEAGIGPLDGILADFGVSSRQLDSAARGFSFSQDGPLDMRMNQHAGRPAADLVNQADAAELERILREYGEERNARRIARAIVERRAKQPFTTTGDLAALIASVSPRHGRTHPATQSFQAIRIAVNEELAALSDFLAHIPRWIKPGGRLALISFHSMEDRMVKQALARCSTEWLDRPEWPEPRRNPEHCLRLLTRKPVEASREEVKSNPRARSAKLRAAERLPA